MARRLGNLTHVNRKQIQKVRDRHPTTKFRQSNVRKELGDKVRTFLERDDNVCLKKR